MDGHFKIYIDQKTDSLFFIYIGMEMEGIRLKNECELVEILIMNDVLYHYSSSKKMDRLRKKRYNNLVVKHSEAVKKRPIH